jgi:hypothetical protein
VFLVYVDESVLERERERDRDTHIHRERRIEREVFLDDREFLDDLECSRKPGRTHVSSLRGRECFGERERERSTHTHAHRRERDSFLEIESFGTISSALEKQVGRAFLAYVGESVWRERERHTHTQTHTHTHTERERESFRTIKSAL